MTTVVFDSPAHANGGCIFDAGILTPVEVLPCIFDSPAHANGGCIFDNQLTDGRRAANHVRFRQWADDEEDVIMALVATFLELVS